MSLSSDDDIVERILFGEFLDEYQGDVEDDVTSETSSTDEKPKRRKRHRITLKQEIDALRAKETDLRATLDMLSKRAELPLNASVWETRAKDQVVAAQKTLQENTFLRNMLQEQLKTINALERVLKKKPKLVLTPQFDHDEWRTWRLGVDSVARDHSMRAILSHLHDRMESELIKNSVYDLKDGHLSLELRTRHNVLWFDFMQCHALDATMDVVAAGLWAVFCQRVKIPRTSFLDSTGSILHQVDEDTVYTETRSVVTHNLFDVAVEGRFLIQRIVEATRTVFVYRSLLQDDLFPHSPNGFRDNTLGWIVLQPCPGNPDKTIKYVMSQVTKPPRSHEPETEAPDAEDIADFALNLLSTHSATINDLITKTAA
ncbi:hypothetical protein SPRG_20350 [Saprolegnia parasitica CBS 223.65]|uniref:START domain-containing protein n=1 Tax=Saprolegnia parasitica (strain CBS 223.65) TaxID=695850 RepID=A0A067CBR5_SAPPC|nr:hypothetical protein SPRG_20350 [Saprolegnia parasitica CBS 223.65]KDO27953.1 hypothetical protein SPRG_20350 [Saprolegnia parasitica CBS 223.65]|eukprot:XP_012201466.1 hypothetical protein SPRG_20350 [Saprolegnia parasitica CBS 223.65]